MTTAREEGDPFADAMREAVGASVDAWRLITAVADAVRRHRQRRQKDEEEVLPPAEEAVNRVAPIVQKVLPPDISAALMSGADWPQTAQRIAALRRAGVDLDDFLPRVAEIAVTVRDSLAENAARVSREGTGEWERLLRETLPAGPVREAILSSPTWPDIAATMARLDERGVDVRRVLATAHDEGVVVDRAVARVLGADAAPVASRYVMLSYGPLTTGLDVPRDLDLSDRARALRQLAVSPAENERYCRWVREALPGREQEAGLLLSARRWPLVAARMAKMESEGVPVRERLTRLTNDASWQLQQGPRPQLGARLVAAVDDALRRAPEAGGAGPGSRVDAAAARSRSTSMDPTERQTAVTGPASVEPAVAAHRTAGENSKPTRDSTR
ncbi:hypothetical protein [Streptomyces sp. AC602_WCS936]|uniref:hypothetical protein n=1 Tax=Streptomyces sp. AC602_WCS936 TaxID=2823685 RepID=UPI001C27C233|nr:hypothetical protein [Streptomyces sp. AC602_WCS936]